MGKKTLPVLLGLVTAALIALALWPNEPPRKTVVVAARDLGAGTVLTAGDLTTRTVLAWEAPADALADPAPLLGQTLAVPRFRGEAVTLRHIGPPVALKPYERGVAVKVALDTGLAGLLRPGMKVSVAGILDDGTSTQVKVMLEHLRVLYVSPDFQARPAAPAVAQATVRGGRTTDLLAGGRPAYAMPTRQAQEGVVILAVPITATAVTYTPIVTDTITTTLPLDTARTWNVAAAVTETTGITATRPVTVTPTLTVTAAVGYYGLLDARRVWVNPVELLTALNARGSLALILEPQEGAQPFFSPGVVLEDLAVRRPEEVGP